MLCIDHPVVQAMIPRIADRRIVTYGISPQADVRAVDIALGPSGGRYRRRHRRPRATDRARLIEGLRLPMFGEHNVQNSLAAIAVADEMGVGDETLRKALGQLRRRQAPLHQAPARSTASP